VSTEKVTGEEKIAQAAPLPTPTPPAAKPAEKAPKHGKKSASVVVEPKPKKEGLKKSVIEPLRAQYVRYTPSAFRRIREPLLKLKDTYGDKEDLGLMISEVHAYLGLREKNHEWVALAKKEAFKWEKENPKDPRSPRALAWTFWANGEVVQATLFAQKALEAKPGDPIARYILGSAIYRTGNETEGLTTLKDTYAKYPESFPVGEALAQVYLRREQYSDAEAIVKKLESQEPGDPVVEDMLAETLEGEGKWQEVISRYEPIAKKSPTRYDLKLLLSQAYRRTDNYKEANRHLTHLVSAQEAGKLKLNPEREVIYYQERGKLAFDQGQYAKSVRHFERALEIDPSNSATLKYLAGAQFREKDYKAAAVTYERAVQAQPDDISTRQYHGMALFESGQLDKAEIAFKDAQKRGTETALSYYYLARIRESRGRTSEAATMCEKALQIDPAYENAKTLLAKLKAKAAPAAAH
jgi:tetratricopeptide (TPR) repeat protein